MISLYFARQNYERMNLADALVPKSYEKGERIIKQGDLQYIQFPLVAFARQRA